MRGQTTRVLTGLVFFVLCTFALLFFYCDHNHCLFSQKTNAYSIDMNFDRKLLDKDYDLDLEDEDVLVFLHMQKTGGTTFGKHLVKNLDIDQPCECSRGKKKCNCLTRKQTVWLFSRYSTGWACGLHADWTELKGCVDKEMDKQEGLHRKRRFHYITILRDPVRRYISEWKHVQRGATWKSARLYCNGHQASLEEVPFCFEGSTWEGVSLEEFLKCKYNLANNRQTRMLANLSKVNCYNGTGMSEELRQRLLLESAVENLKNMSFFGMTEYQKDTQLLFEDTFHIKFSKSFEQYNRTHSEKAENKITEEDIKEIKNVNALDIKLYDFAKRLFLERVKVMKDEMKADESSSMGNSVENRQDTPNKIEVRQEMQIKIEEKHDMQKYKIEERQDTQITIDEKQDSQNKIDEKQDSQNKIDERQDSQNKIKERQEQVNEDKDRHNSFDKAEDVIDTKQYDNDLPQN